MKTVLAPIDFSAAGARVLDHAIALARAIDARLVLLNVVPLSSFYAAEFAESEAAAGVVQRAAQESQRRLTELQRSLRDRGVTAHAIHRTGLPGAVIVEQADRLEADYVVMGSHGHGAFYDLMVGSTTMRVLKQVRCPVVIVSPGEALAQPAAGERSEAAPVRP